MVTRYLRQFNEDSPFLVCRNLAKMPSTSQQMYCLTILWVGGWVGAIFIVQLELEREGEAFYTSVGVEYR